MAKINENVLAKQVSECEGKQVEVNIAQIKEVLRVTFDILALDYPVSQVVELLERRTSR